MKRRSALVGSLAAMAAATAAKANTPVDLQLVLAVDVSRSIDEVEAELQRRGYIEALTNDRVIDAILSGEHRHFILSRSRGVFYRIEQLLIDLSGEIRVRRVEA